MYVHRYWHEHELKTAAEVGKIAAEAGVSPAKLAVGWVAADPVVSAVIIGASRPEQLADTLDAVDVPVAPDVKAHLDELTAEYRKGDAPK
jgi:aryl-alcohol dehydrogenase-like predicted oxidoreductase